MEGEEARKEEIQEPQVPVEAPQVLPEAGVVPPDAGPAAEEVKDELKEEEKAENNEKSAADEGKSPDENNLPDADLQQEKKSEEAGESRPNQESLNEKIEGSDKSNLMQVHINLKDLNEVKKSSMNFDIADSLMYKDALEKAKFKAFKQKFKANEAQECREAPLINKNSHKILIKKEETTKKKEVKKTNIKYDKYDEHLLQNHPTQRLSAVLRLKACDPLNPEVMKASLEARKDFESVKKAEELKKVDLIARCKQAEQAQNPVESKSSLKVSTSSSSLVHKPTKSLPQVTSVDNLSSRVPPPNKQLFPGKLASKPSDSVMISEKYSQLTPYSASVKYNSGYNNKEILTKGRPMVDYKMQLLPN